MSCRLTISGLQVLMLSSALGTYMVHSFVWPMNAPSRAPSSLRYVWSHQILVLTCSDGLWHAFNHSPIVFNSWLIWLPNRRAHNAFQSRSTHLHTLAPAALGMVHTFYRLFLHPPPVLKPSLPPISTTPPPMLTSGDFGDKTGEPSSRNPWATLSSNALWHVYRVLLIAFSACYILAPH